MGGPWPQWLPALTPMIQYMCRPQNPYKYKRCILLELAGQVNETLAYILNHLWSFIQSNNINILRTFHLYNYHECYLLTFGQMLINPATGLLLSLTSNIQCDA